MPFSPEFTCLLDKYNIPHDVSGKDLADIARQKLILAPTTLDAYILAYSQIPKTYEEFAVIVDFVNLQQDDGYSLADALKKLNKAAKIFTSE